LVFTGKISPESPMIFKWENNSGFRLRFSQKKINPLNDMKYQWARWNVLDHELEAHSWEFRISKKIPGLVMSK
jgi:hypothetical protein